MFYAGWLLLGMVAIVLGVAMPNVLRRQTIYSQVGDELRYSPHIRLLDLTEPPRQYLCNTGALPLVFRTEGSTMFSRSDVVVLQARRAALVADSRAAAVRRGAVAAVAAMALVVVVILVARGVIGAPWIALPAVPTALIGLAAWRAGDAAKGRLERIDAQIAEAREREQESVAAVLARRLERRREAVGMAAEPTVVATVPFKSEAVRVQTGWTPMPVPEPLFAQPRNAGARVARRRVEVAQVEAQLEARDQARTVYRPTELQGIENGMSTEEAAAPAVARLDVNSAIDRRRAASF